MEVEINTIKHKYKLEEINKRNEIQATRLIYKSLGKDPNRYRPSSEALCRRILRGLAVYRINTLVDIINFVSIRSGFSIGCFDLDLINGNLNLEVGSENEEFDAIGRGQLNISSLPIYRDAIGGIGTPTSDSERTKISEKSTHAIIIINDYGNSPNLETALNHSIELLKRYAGLVRYELNYID
jgi:DNA/RNA-binding domain of Phe-tRNA-synthetase-like protein